MQCTVRGVGAGPTTYLAPQFAAAATGPVTYQAAPASAVPGPMQLAPSGGTVNAVVPVSLPPPMYAAAAAPPPRQQSVLAPTAAAFQPVIYWYPSPPVSPQTAPGYYVQSTLPTTVLMKGLPPNVQIHDVLSFLDGLVEV